NDLDENQITFDFNNELSKLFTQIISENEENSNIELYISKYNNDIKTELELDNNNNEQNFDYTCDKEINELISDNEELINKEKKSNV
ncbi:11140_t:CDS:1, partial [Diversispora eburnea]